jgi:hypothetical protein
MVIANTLRSAGVTALNTGTGYWVDASTSTPTFRVGNPSAEYLRWDGTNLTVNGTYWTIDANGIAMIPSSSIDTWSSVNSYRWTVSNGEVGLGAFDYDNSGTRRRGIRIATHYTSAANNSQDISLVTDSDQGNNVSTVLVSASNGNASITLSAFDNGTNYAGRINMSGILNFNNAAVTAASAGSNGAVPSQVCGYLKAYYAGDTSNPIRIPFFAASGGSCPTVP